MPGAQLVDLCPPSMHTNFRIYDSASSDPFNSCSKSAVHDMQNLHIYDSAPNDPSNVGEPLYPTAWDDTVNLRGIQEADHVMGDVSLSTPQRFSTDQFVASESTAQIFFRAAHSTPNSLPVMRDEEWHSNVRAVNTRQVSKTAPYICQWRTEPNSVCGDVISWATCGEHFAITHGLRNMRSGLHIMCHWCSEGGRLMKRENVVRHVREAHLGKKRFGVSNK